MANREVKQKLGKADGQAESKKMKEGGEHQKGVAYTRFGRPLKQDIKHLMQAKAGGCYSFPPISSLLYLLFSLAVRRDG